MNDPFREMLTRSASAIKESEVVLGRVETVTRAVERQVDHSRALIRNAYGLLEMLRDRVAGDAYPFHVWRLHGQSAHCVECTIEQRGPAFRVLIARNSIEVIAEQFRDPDAAIARANQLGTDLINLGWVDREHDSDTPD